MMDAKGYLNGDLETNYYYEIGIPLIEADKEEFINESLKKIKESKSWKELTSVLTVIFGVFKRTIIPRSQPHVKGDEWNKFKEAVKERLLYLKKHEPELKENSRSDGYSIICILDHFFGRSSDYLNINNIDTSISQSRVKKKDYPKILDLLIKGFEMELKGEDVLNENERIEEKKRREYEELMESLSDKQFKEDIKRVIKNKMTGYLTRVFEVSIKDIPEHSLELFNKLMIRATKILYNEMKETKELDHWERIRLALTIVKYPIRELTQIETNKKELTTMQKEEINKFHSSEYRSFIYKLKNEIENYRNAVGQDNNIYQALKDIHEFITNPNKEFIKEKEFSKNKDKIINEIINRLI